eukprot:860953_1
MNNHDTAGMYSDHNTSQSMSSTTKPSRAIKSPRKRRKRRKEPQIHGHLMSFSDNKVDPHPVADCEWFEDDLNDDKGDGLQERVERLEDIAFKLISNDGESLEPTKIDGENGLDSLAIESKDILRLLVCPKLASSDITAPELVKCCQLISKYKDDLIRYASVNRHITNRLTSLLDAFQAD